MVWHDWARRARCREVGSEVFFADDVAGDGSHLYRHAKRVCAECPVWRECRLAGLGEDWGVWGGLSPLQRRNIRAEEMKKVQRNVGGIGSDGHLRAFRQKVTRTWSQVGSVDGVLDAMPLLNHPLMHVFTLGKNQGSARSKTGVDHDAA